MSTRSLTIVKNVNNKVLMTMYKNHDSEPKSYGKKLATLLRDIDNTKSNGIECVAAQVVAHFKKSRGDIYLYPESIRDIGESYMYNITANSQIKVYKITYPNGKYVKREMFSGRAGEYLEFLCQQEA